jgi:hypothetical protein
MPGNGRFGAPLSLAPCRFQELDGTAQAQCNAPSYKLDWRRTGMEKWSLRLAATLCAVLALPALAHHGWSGYDSSKTITLTGSIVQASYTYPHATIKLQTADKTWEAVLAPPSRMSMRGIPGEALKVGATATVEGYPSRQHDDEMRAERITLDGKTVELR